MATLTEIEIVILSPMRSLYRSPFGIDSPEDALVEYAKVLKRFTFDELEAGWSWLLLTYKRRDWPSILDLCEAIKAARPSPVIDRRAAPPYTPEVDTRTPEERKRVGEMFDLWHANKKSYVKLWEDPRYRECRADFETRTGELIPEPVIYPIDPVVEAWERGRPIINRQQASEAGASEKLKSLIAKQRAKEST